MQHWTAKLKLRTASSWVTFSSVSATGSNQNDLYLKKKKKTLRDSCWIDSFNQRIRDLRLCGSPQTDWTLQMSPRSWAQICWLQWQKGASLLVADPEPLGTGTCLLQTLNQDLCHFFPLFQTRVCLPGLLARQSEIPSASSIYWYRTCYPPTQRPALHTVWSLMKPFRWRLLMSTHCTVLPCTEVFQGICRQHAACPCVWWEIPWLLEEKWSHWHSIHTR